MSHIHFEEEQRFTNIPWLRVVIFIPLFIPFLLIDRQTATDEIIRLLLTAGAGWLAPVTILFYSRFRIEVNNEGLRYKFFPAVWKWKVIGKDNIASVEIKPVKSIFEKFEIGYRNKFFSSTIQMNITGTAFVWVQLHAGKTLKIGTENAEGLAQALQRLTLNTED